MINFLLNAVSYRHSANENIISHQSKKILLIG